MRFISFGCSGAYPMFQIACSSYFIQTDDANMLFDCGAGSLSNLVGYIDPTELDAIFISHWHADHCSDLFVLAYLYQFKLSKGKKIKLYTIKTENSLLYQEACRLSCFEIIDIKEGSAVKINSTSVCAYKAVHPVPSLMFSIADGNKKLFYTGDTNYYDGIIDFIKGSNVLISTAFFIRDEWSIEKPQLSAYLAASIAKQANVDMLYITHLNPKTSKKLLFDEAFSQFKNTKVLEQNKLYNVWKNMQF